MIGPRVGVKSGLMAGPRIGVGADQIAPQGGPTTLTAALADSADPVITGGDAFSYAVSIQNVGSNPASGVTVTLTLDASLAYVSSSGTGWTLSHLAGVVTATRSVLAVGAAPDITINVTTGGAALTASTSVSVVATNATTPAADIETTAVGLVSKDATSGIYYPANSAEWTRFLARKVPAIAVPSALHGFQEPSGNIIDQIAGTYTLQATGGRTYQQAVAGHTRKAIYGTGGSVTHQIIGGIPNLATNSFLSLVIALVETNAGASPMIYAGGGPAVTLRNTAGGLLRATSNNIGNTADGTSIIGVVKPLSLRSNNTASTVTGFSDTDKVSPTWAASAGTTLYVDAGAPAFVLYAVHWFGAGAEITDANWKALLSAMGFLITWVP